MNKPVIVAPGWSYEKAVIASKYGAEEVYIWVPFTSLRMRQNKVKDFSELKKTIQAIHDNWSKALLTMNIFPRNSDIKVFESVVEQIADTNPDAIIFSDPGTFNVIRKHFPDTPLHLSTQASTLNYESIKFRRDLWVKRIILARELSIEEIKEIKEKVPDIELEIFVHGAMCMSYSWRCLLGDYMSGRQANKWECNHACRFKYKVWLEEDRRPGKLFQLDNDEDWSYILSSKDLCTIDRLAEIMPYVDAIKIEWRSKSEFYVWSVVKAYKSVRDAIVEWREPDLKAKELVEKIPHRPYWDWFLFNWLKDFPETEEESVENEDKIPLIKTLTDKDFGLDTVKSEKYEERKAARCVLQDNDWNVAILYVKKDNYYKIPGGWIENGESVLEALVREVKEEAGIDLIVSDVIGKIIEYRDKWKLKHTNICYSWMIDGEKWNPEFTNWEIADWFEIMRKPLDEAIEIMWSNKVEVYGGMSKQARDLLFLKTFRDIKYVTSTNLDSPGPTFCRNYFGIFKENFIEKDGKKYFEFTPKEVLERGMKLNFLSATEIWELTIVDLLKEWWQELERANCNTPKVFVLTDKEIQGWEILYE